MPVARARVSQTGKISDFTTLKSRASGAVQGTLGVGECGNICFGHVPVAVRQGKRRDAVATGEARPRRFAAGQSNYIRLYLYSGKLILAATYLRRLDSMAVAFGRALQHWRMFVLLSAQHLSVGLRRPSRGRVCGGTLRAMARIAPARPATPHSTNKPYFFSIFYLLFVFSKEIRNKGEAGSQAGRQSEPRILRSA
jgi:hypothetical protein